MYVLPFKSTTHYDDIRGNGSIAPHILKFEHLIKVCGGFTTESLYLPEKGS